MRRLLLLVLAACLAGPAQARADGFVVDFSGMQPGVEVYGFEDCPGSLCAPSPVTLAVERAGVYVGKTGRRWPSRPRATAGARASIARRRRTRVAVRTTGPHAVTVPKGAVVGTDNFAAVPLAPTRFAARLAGRRRARLTVAVRFIDPAGAAADWTRTIVVRRR